MMKFSKRGRSERRPGEGLGSEHDRAVAAARVRPRQLGAEDVARRRIQSLEDAAVVMLISNRYSCHARTPGTVALQ